MTTVAPPGWLGLVSDAVRTQLLQVCFEGNAIAAELADRYELDETSIESLVRYASALRRARPEDNFKGGKVFRDLLQLFYMEYNPPKVGDVDRMIAKYKGGETEVYRSALQKYKVDQVPQQQFTNAGGPAQLQRVKDEPHHEASPSPPARSLASPSPPSAPPSPPPSPPKWTEHADPRTGRVFYYNRSTGAKQWEEPLETSAPAPARVPPGMIPDSSSADLVAHLQGQLAGLKERLAVAKAGGVHLGLASTVDERVQALPWNKLVARNAGPQAATLNLTAAIINDPARLRAACHDLTSKMAPYSANHMANVVVTCAANVFSACELHERVEAMGVQVVHSQADAALPQVPTPFADITGDASQPGLVITYQVYPAVTLSLQARPKKGWVTIKTRRGVLMTHVQILLAFLGPAVEVTANAPCVRKTVKTETPKGSGVDLLALLQRKAGPQAD